MPTILLDDVRSFAPITEGISNKTLQLYIDTVAGADDCLALTGLNQAMQKILKLNAIAHLVVKSQGGQVSAERDFDGASVNYETYKADGYGLSSTTYGQVVASSGVRCFDFMDANPNSFIRAIG